MTATSEISSVPIVNEWIVEKRWTLPYPEYLLWLENTQAKVRENKKLKFLLITSHPTCHTMGRGLRANQKSDEKISQDILTFNELEKLESVESHNTPLYRINRGGGLTKHHPGQIIIYFVMHLDHYQKSLLTFMVSALKNIQLCLENEYGGKNFSIPKERFGLWCGEKKICSIGMGLERYVTGHGFALNYFDESLLAKKINREINNKTFYCGLSNDQYSNVCELMVAKNQWKQTSIETLMELKNKFTLKLLNYFL